jgi:hypothetical protein
MIAKDRRTLAMCLREGVEAATWVGFSAVALLLAITPLVFG